ncbi:MAG: hypothetical protein DRR16_06455 [Candidatus Parabeggiatoa sp. nov. 3]|jgi:ketosteroid isomerase-like protein|nr:nuclear transport factor 2 family protein [Candidatus Parabeggiatoa sp.]RKZ51351.1 MAG: hypothetical protein DRR00_12025 [Gammaproteobacteria bacterium]RKZ67220.1 MAG: hypothetical protein DRQ99_07320 [Gammaproteobacteria bacterium]RKZ87797.1 MAG: hypothetical protein DRR16_06455 [Gammaproteobacteria bacterium]HEW97600.1 hypothetical protein [Beggiatoa sp.]
MSEGTTENLPIGQHEQEHLKNVIEMLTAFRQDKIQEALSYFTDDVEWRVSIQEEFPMGGIFYGLKGVQQFFENHNKLFDIESDEHCETVVQGNKVVIIGHERAHIRPHGKLYEADYASTFVFREGKISRCYVFGDSAALLKAYRGE